MADNQSILFSSLAEAGGKKNPSLAGVNIVENRGEPDTAGLMRPMRG
ncbi:MAG: hypothetical protein ABI847_05400 [Anaerolineales bacterium]